MVKEKINGNDIRRIREILGVGQLAFALATEKTKRYKVQTYELGLSELNKEEELDLLNTLKYIAIKKIETFEKIIEQIDYNIT